MYQSNIKVMFNRVTNIKNKAKSSQPKTLNYRQHSPHYNVWHSPQHRVASAASSCGFRRIIVWHSPQHRVAFATSPCGIRHGRHACNIPFSFIKKAPAQFMPALWMMLCRACYLATFSKRFIMENINTAERRQRTMNTAHTDQSGRSPHR